MNNSLEFFVELIGERQAAEMLKRGIQKSLKSNSYKLDDESVEENKPKIKKGKRLMFTEEEKEIMLVRARQLFPELKAWAKVASTIAKELGRERTSVVYNFLYRNGVVKELNDEAK